MAHGENIVEFCELALDLLQAGLVGDQEQHATCGAVFDRRADDGIEIESATREQAGDMRHGSRVIAHAQFEYGGPGRGGV